MTDITVKVYGLVCNSLTVSLFLWQAIMVLTQTDKKHWMNWQYHYQPSIIDRDQILQTSSLVEILLLVT